MTVFDYIISPFLHFIKWIYALWFGLTGSHGISIVLLSFTVSLVLLPIFIYIEKTKKRNDAVKARMKPLVDEIKRSYRGQERYYYLKTLNRQHGFNPFKAMIPIFSLLLQIPFFIAAYQFLADYEALAGVRFLFISDLSQPDGLLGSVHLLPILMTVVNVATAYLYTLRGDKAERNQMYVVAGLFLILLFNLPSGLVLYWTLNNVFSFFRLFITHPEVFKRVEGAGRKPIISLEALKLRFKVAVPSLLHTLWVVFAIGMLSQLNWALGHGFNGFGHRIQLTAVGSLGIVLLFLLFNMLYSAPSWVREEGVKGALKAQWPIFRITFFLLAVVLILTQVNWALNHGYSSIVPRIAIAFLAALAATAVVAFIVSAYQRQIRFPRPTGRYNVFKLGKGYQIFAAIILVTGIYLQVQWAMGRSFGSIIPRILIVGLISWLLPLLMSRGIEYLNQSVGFNFSDTWIEIKEKQKSFYVLFTALFLALLLLQFNWAINHTFEGILIRILAVSIASIILTFLLIFTQKLWSAIKKPLLGITLKPYIIYSLLFLGLYFYISAQYHFEGFNDQLSIAGTILIGVTQLLLLWNLNKIIAFGDKWMVAIKGIVYILVFVQLINVTSLLSGGELEIGILRDKLYFISETTVLISQFGFIAIALLLPSYISSTATSRIEKPKSFNTVSILAILFLTAYIFILHPVSVFFSSPSSFDFFVSELIKVNIIPMLIVFTVSTGVVFLLPKRCKYVAMVLVLTLVVSTIIYSALFPLNMDTMQMHKFSNTKPLETSFFLHLIEGLGLVAVFAVLYWGIKRVKSQFLLWILVFAFVVPIIQGISGYYTSKGILLDEESSTEYASTITFSKNNENVVVILLDMFQGWYMEKILEDHPEIKDELTGFVWFPNVMSASNFTISSMPSILAGPEFTPNLLDQDSTRNLYQKMDYSGSVFREKVKEKDYHLIGSHLSWTGNRTYYFDDFIPHWHPDWRQYKSVFSLKDVRNHDFKVLRRNALFFSLPLALKSKIYDQGNWLLPELDSDEQTNLVKKYNFLRALQHISRVEDIQKTFMFFSVEVTHFPWNILDDDGVFHKDVTPYENNLWGFEKVVELMQWMKENDVYDNSKIILLSDHGIRRSKIADELILLNPFTFSEDSDVDLSTLFAFTPLLMVKDFHSKEQVSENNRFMSTTDLMEIALKEGDYLQNIPEHNRKIRGYFLHYNIVYKNKTFPIQAVWEVTDNIFDLNNWKHINE